MKVEQEQNKNKMEFKLQVWILLLLSFYQQYTGVEAKTDVYVGLNEMGRLFRRGDGQFAVLTVKEQVVDFNVIALPKEGSNQMAHWLDPQNNDNVFKSGRLMAARPGKDGHSEMRILSGENKNEIKGWIKNTKGNVDLMLYTYNSPCCMSTGDNGQTVMDNRINKMKNDGNKWQGCDAASCSKLIDDFIKGKIC